MVLQDKLRQKTTSSVKIFILSELKTWQRMKKHTPKCRQITTLTPFTHNLTNQKNWHDTTYFDSEDDYCIGCWNISHCQQQQSYSDLHSPGLSNSAYFWNDSCTGFKLFTIFFFFTNIKQITIGRTKSQGPGITPEYDPTEYFLRSKKIK